jgi:hypothetical protein
MRRVFDKKLIVFHLVKKFTAFYEPLVFIAMVTRAFHLLHIPWQVNDSILLHAVSLRSILVLSFLLNPRPFVLQGVLTKTVVHPLI